MFTGEGFKKLSHRSAFPSLGLLQSPAHATNTLQKFLIFQQLLVSPCALISENQGTNRFGSTYRRNVSVAFPASPAYINSTI